MYENRMNLLLERLHPLLVLLFAIAACVLLGVFDVLMSRPLLLEYSGTDDSGPGASAEPHFVHAHNVLSNSLFDNSESPFLGVVENHSQLSALSLFKVALVSINCFARRLWFEVTVLT